MLSCCFFAKSKKSPTPTYTPVVTQTINPVALTNTNKIDTQAITQTQFELGSGVSSVVFYGKWSGKDVAIKQFKDDPKDTFNREKNIADAFIRIQNKSDHIIQYYGYMEDEMHSSLVMEYMPTGDLAHYVLGNTPPNLMISMFIACDIAHGLQWLKQYHIIHCDIKLENILLQNNFLAKITDFGSCVVESDSHCIKSLKGTAGYVAPEVLNAFYTDNFLPYTYSTDVYAFGITLLEIMNSASAYDNQRTTYSINAEIMTGKRPKITADCPKNVANLITFALSANPKQRPEITKIADDLEGIRSSLSF